MVEAAIVFPIVIITAFTMLHTMLKLYEESDFISQSQLNSRITAEAKVETSKTLKAGDLYICKEDVNSVSDGKIYEWYEQAIDEEETVRYLDFGKSFITR